jgi:hypothetical protein
MKNNQFFLLFILFYSFFNRQNTAFEEITNYQTDAKKKLATKLFDDPLSLQETLLSEHFSEEECTGYSKLQNICSFYWPIFYQQIMHLSPEFLRSLVTKEVPLIYEKNQQSKKKDSVAIENILFILKKIYSKAEKIMPLKAGLAILKKFIDSLEEDINRNPLQTNKYYVIALKHIFELTGNSLPLAKGNESINEIIKKMQFSGENLLSTEADFFKVVILWTFFIYDKIEQIFTQNSSSQESDGSNITTAGSFLSEENGLFFYFYPLFIKSKETTFNKIRFNESLQYFFGMANETIYSLPYLMKIEKYPKNMNSSMAYFEFIQKNIFLSLLHNEKNDQLVKKIKLIFSDIASISKEMYCLEQGISSNKGMLEKIFNFFKERKTLGQYLEQHVPFDIFFPFNGKNSLRSVYVFYSMYNFYSRGLSLPIDSFLTQKEYYEDMGGMSWTRNPLTKIIPFSGMFLNYFDKKPYGGLLAKKDTNEILRRKIEWTPTDFIKKWELEGGRKNSSIIYGIAQLFPWSIGTILGGSVNFAFTQFVNCIRAYDTVQTIVSTVSAIKTYHRYFSLLSKLVTKCNKLLRAIKILYQENNIKDCFILPEIKQVADIFSQNIHTKKKKSLLREVLEEEKHPYKKKAKLLVNFVAPGLMANFYFNSLQKSYELETLQNFIGMIDTSFSKLKLLTLEGNNTNTYVYSVPHLKNPKKEGTVSLAITDMWYPPLKHKAVKNSIHRSGNHKNMMLVSPIAGGKTVFLSTLLGVLYFSNIGIVPAERAEFSYFHNIIDHFEHSYLIGDGLSQHLAEKESMKILKNIFLENTNQKPKNNNFIIIDEFYKGTIPELAIEEALIELPPILKDDNTMVIMTSHYPKITKITERPDCKMDIFYLEVKRILNGVFEKTYTLKPDDENNWWIRNPSIALEYERAQ